MGPWERSLGCWFLGKWKRCVRVNVMEKNVISGNRTEYRAMVQVTGGKLREITEEAKSFVVGNRGLAALFVHSPAGELQRQIRNWLAENFDFLWWSNVTSFTTAIMDGWMVGLGSAMPPSTDALGQLLSKYAKRVNNSQ
ncbi:hypothetical protein H5410_056075 [Solanum commersonii]|uniref:Uncharacterized protein n=1 Tax=Solanum commersonii TaxID=4109 RepID=A0A9J5WKM4_SOLCO|nr:hypothetical protein H5410_056075 [Solanum commersonii]